MFSMIALYHDKVKGFGEFVTIWFLRRSAKGSWSDVHLIHRGAVPLPLEGKANSALQGRCVLQCRARLITLREVRRLGWHLIHREAVPLPLRGEGINTAEIGARLRMPGAQLYAARQRIFPFKMTAEIYQNALNPSKQ